MEQLSLFWFFSLLHSLFKDSHFLVYFPFAFESLATVPNAGGEQNSPSDVLSTKYCQSHRARGWQISRSNSND